MNAPASITIDSRADAWASAEEEVHTWRGAAIQHFAQAEWAVSTALLVLQRAAPHAIKLRRLVGQRFTDLRDAIGPKGNFGTKGEKALAALNAFGRYEPMRPFLCHGMAKVTLDRHGHWLVVLKINPFSGREGEPDLQVFSQKDAEAMLVGLAASGRKLSAALQSLRDRVDAEMKHGQVAAA